MLDTCNTKELIINKKKLLFMVNRPNLIMERGEGCFLFDSKGKKYLDFIGGWATNSLGHNPEVIQRALREQAATLINCSPAYYNKPMLEYAKMLTQVSGMDKVFFGSSGAEANECAIKLARKYGAIKKNGAYEIIALNKSFHGRTLATMSLSGKKKWSNLFEPKVPGFLHVPINNLSKIKESINYNTCAIILELIQGEGGVNKLDLEYLYGIKQLVEENKILLIFDEIQTGLARTGKLFAFEHFLDKKNNFIKPDIITLGKGIGGGFPLSAMITTNQYDIFSAGDNGGTYIGQPLAMAVGKAVLSEILRLELWKVVKKNGEHIKSRLMHLSNKFPVHDVRGEGLLIAFSWNNENTISTNAIQLSKLCLNAGLLINALGDNSIRLMPPLIITEKEINKFFNILESVLISTI